MQHFYKSIPGFFNYESVYDKVIDKLETGANIVEIGVWKGMSVAYAAVKVLQLKKDIKIYAVDTFEGSSGEVGPLDKNNINSDSVYEECRTNLEPVSSIVSIIRSDSIEASKMFDDQSLDFVFIDAAHSYQYVKADIEAWLPKVKSGGFIGGHDYLNNDPTHADGGVTRAVQEIFKNYNIEQMGSEIFSWLVELKKD
jgi:hypothetical protein